MIPAKIRVEDDERDYGTWQFAALPRVGEAVIIRVNDAAATYKVTTIVHIPLISTTPLGHAFPRAEVFLRELVTT